MRTITPDASSSIDSLGPTLLAFVYTLCAVTLRSLAPSTMSFVAYDNEHHLESLQADSIRAECVHRAKQNIAIAEASELEDFHLIYAHMLMMVYLKLDMKDLRQKKTIFSCKEGRYPLIKAIMLAQVSSGNQA